MNIRQAILQRVEDYLSLTGMTERAFGKVAAADPDIVGRLRRTGVTLTKIEEIEAYLDRVGQGMRDLDDGKNNGLPTSVAIGENDSAQFREPVDG